MGLYQALVEVQAMVEAMTGHHQDDNATAVDHLDVDGRPDGPGLRGHPMVGAMTLGGRAVLISLLTRGLALLCGAAMRLSG